MAKAQVLGFYRSSSGLMIRSVPATIIQLGLLRHAGVPYLNHISVVAATLHADEDTLTSRFLYAEN
jgi:hypothetical protein